jgi:hypothetical protein
MMRIKYLLRCACHWLRCSLPALEEFYEAGWWTRVRMQFCGGIWIWHPDRGRVWVYQINGESWRDALEED